MIRHWLFAFAVLSAILAGLVWWLQPPTWVFPLAVVLVFLIYTNTALERVPLYLSNQQTWAALSAMLDARAPQTTASANRPAFVDLGCGLGGVVAHLARRHPEWHVVGVETAPLPYCVAKLRTVALRNAEIRFQSLWKVDLGRFDVAYAFLSPAPMPRLIDKAHAELKPGAVLISNSFWADGATPHAVVELSDRRRTQLIVFEPSPVASRNP